MTRNNSKRENHMINDTDSPLITTFMGPVGVGKTTQIRLLEKYFESKDRKSVKTYIKSTHGLCYLLLILFRILGISNKGISIDSTISYRSTLSFQKRITPIWNLFDTISIIGKFFLTVYLPYLLGYNIIIEEGLQMTKEHYKRFRPHFIGVEPKQLPLMDVLLNWITSRKHLDIILDAGEQEIVNRRMSRMFRRYESEKFIELQRRALSSIDVPNVLYIDTSGKSISAIHKLILNHIECRPLKIEK